LKRGSAAVPAQLYNKRACAIGHRETPSATARLLKTASPVRFHALSTP
jgi:hypothetical protein